jgi:hypothetical protein
VLLIPPFPALGEKPCDTPNPAYTPAASTPMAKVITATGRRKPSLLGRACRFAGPGTNRSTVRYADSVCRHAAAATLGLPRASRSVAALSQPVRAPISWGTRMAI